MWRSLLSFAREYDSQLITSTHNEEWIEALIEAAGDDVDDIALWRIERVQGRPTVRQFFGKTLKAGVDAGGEVR